MLKRTDYLFLVSITSVIALIFYKQEFLETYLAFNKAHGMVTSFFKFGLLATMGEVIGHRISKGNYQLKQFGLFPKFIYWGFIGLSIKIAFVIFASGTPVVLEYLGIKNAKQAMLGELNGLKIISALGISLAMNVIYAPIMMTFHKLSDLHIEQYQGKSICLIKWMQIDQLLNKIDWQTQWHFVFKKTIPLFWIPAHTITFLLPADYQVLFAAILSIMLGTILSLATLISEK